MARGRPVSEGENLTKVAAALGIKQGSLTPWTKHPEAPEKPNVEAWKVFADRMGIGKGNSEELRQLKVLIALEDLKKKQRDNAIGEGEVIDRKVIADFLVDLALKIDATITHEFITNAGPQLIGMSIAEIRERLVVAREAVRSSARGNILKWRPGDAVQS